MSILKAFLKPENVKTWQVASTADSIIIEIFTVEGELDKRLLFFGIINIEMFSNLPMLAFISARATSIAFHCL